MTIKKQLNLNQLEDGQTGTVIQLLGGRSFIARLEAIGIRPGNKVTKVCSMLFKGPVTLKSNGTQVALGFGMANKVIVEVEMEITS
jgi:ferrous iron transport protein A